MPPGRPLRTILTGLALTLAAGSCKAQADTLQAMQHPQDTVPPAQARARDAGLANLNDYRPGTGPWYCLPSAGGNGLPLRLPDTALFVPAYRLGDDAFTVQEAGPGASTRTTGRSPASRIRYIFGSKKEQDFSVTHRQPIGRRFAGAVLFRNVNAAGYYRNQATSLRNFRLETAYSAPAGTWTARAGYLSNRLKAGENGGLADPSTFGSSAGGRTATVRLEDAASERKNRAFFLDQRIRLAGGGSDSSVTSPFRLDLVQQGTFSWRKHRFETGQRHPEFFTTAYYDTLSTHDSLRIRNARGRLVLEAAGMPFLDDALGCNSRLYGGTTFEWFHYRQQAADTVLQAWGATGGLDLSFRDSSTASLAFTVNNIGERPGLFTATLGVSRKIGDGLGSHLLASWQKRNPDWIFLFFDANHFRWKNAFDAVGRLDAAAGLSFLKGRHALALDVRYVSDKNPVYFDADALPAQFAGTAARIAGTAAYGISFGPVRLTNRLDWNATDHEDIIRLPAWSWYGSAALERNLFRSALAMHAGVAVRYQSAYKADAYMPATGRFYLQDSLTVGEYPYIDLFADFRIKATRFFIAMEHLNAGWSGYTYFLMPGYPAPGRTIKFGIVWDFSD